MPVLAAIQVVNGRQHGTGTRTIPIAAPPLWQLLADETAVLLGALRDRLSDPLRWQSPSLRSPR